MIYSAAILEDQGFDISFYDACAKPLRKEETLERINAAEDCVELFSKAEYVFADSYHACCFSILFHRQFTVFNRAGTEGKASMNSRMETLFRLFEQHML